MKKKIKRRNYCFACGEANKDGLRLSFDYDPAQRSVCCRLRLNKRYQGATGFAHGGIIATVLDEAMAKVNGKAGLRAVTLKMTVYYRKMVPVSKELVLTGRHTARRGKKLYLRSELRNQDDLLLAEAKGLFLVVG